MIDYSGLNVKKMSEEDLKEMNNSLKNLKFIDSDAAAQSAGIITRAHLPKNLRVIPRGYVTTMDYVEDRIKLLVEEDGVIYKVQRG